VQDEIQKVKNVVEEVQADLTKKKHLATYKPSAQR